MKKIYLLVICGFLFGVVRAQTGFIDSTFGVNGIAITSFGNTRAFARSMVTQPDGKIILAGEVVELNGSSSKFALARYNINGHLDSTFGNNGTVTTSFYFFDAGNSVAIRPDGKIIVGGSSGGGADYSLASYLPNGSLDSTFGNGGTQLLDLGGGVCKSVVLQTDGKILAGGWSYSYNPNYSIFAIERCNSNGTADSSFGVNGIVATDLGGVCSIYSLGLQSDGKIVAAGSFDTSYQNFFAAVRYNIDGTLDSSFGNSGKVITQAGGSGYANSLVIQPDGKIVLAGSGGSELRLIRLNANGTVDSLFGTNGWVETPALYGEGNSVALTQNGKIIVAGSGFTGSPGNYHFVAARYNTDGTLEGINFTELGPGDAYGQSVAVQNDGKVLVAGYYYDSLQYYSYFATVRYNNLSQKPVASFYSLCWSLPHIELTNLSISDSSTARWTLTQKPIGGFCDDTTIYFSGDFVDYYPNVICNEILDSFFVCLSVSNLYGSDTLCRFICSYNHGWTGTVESNQNSISLFPNPANNTVTITVNETLIGSSVSITDITGKKINEQKLETLNTKLETTCFANGIYFVTVMPHSFGDGLGVRSQKFIINNK